MNKFMKYGVRLLFILTVIYTIVIYPGLPEQVPVHWNASGDVDGYANKTNIFILLGIIPLVYLMFPFIRKIDPKKSNYERFEGVYDILQYSVTIMLNVIYILSLFATTNEVQMERIIPILIGLILIIIGNYMPKIKQSYFVGIKTPWTLASEKVWIETHKRGGYVFVMNGIMMIIAGTINNSILTITTFGLLILSTMYLLLYSYQLYKIEKD